MTRELDSVNLKRLNYIKASLEQGELTPPLVLQRFSDLAFSLALKSVKTGVKFEIAVPLQKTLNGYLHLPLISIDTKSKMQALIGETKLDLLYASGNHNISSLRLAPYLMHSR